VIVFYHQVLNQGIAQKTVQRGIGLHRLLLCGYRLADLNRKKVHPTKLEAMIKTEMEELLVTTEILKY